MNCCKTCGRVLEFKRTTLCTYNGKQTELHHYCVQFTEPASKKSKRNPRIERL